MLHEVYAAVVGAHSTLSTGLLLDYHQVQEVCACSPGGSALNRCLGHGVGLAGC